MITYFSFLVSPIFFQHFFFLYLPGLIACPIKSSKDCSQEFSKSPNLWKPSFFICHFDNMRTDLIYTDVFLFQINWYFCFATTLFLLCLIRLIHFHFQLIEINFQFVRNVIFSAITLHNLLISRNQI